MGLISIIGFLGNENGTLDFVKVILDLIESH